MGKLFNAAGIAKKVMSTKSFSVSDLGSLDVPNVGNVNLSNLESLDTSGITSKLTNLGSINIPVIGEVNIGDLTSIKPPDFHIQETIDEKFPFIQNAIETARNKGNEVMSDVASVAMDKVKSSGVLESSQVAELKEIASEKLEDVGFDMSMIEGQFPSFD